MSPGELDPIQRHTEYLDDINSSYVTVANCMSSGSRPSAEVSVIVTCDDLGLCHSVNDAVYRLIKESESWRPLVSGAAGPLAATLVVPSAWSRDAAHRYRGSDVGVSLSVNAEHDNFRWGPVTFAASLLDGNGGLPRTRDEFWDHADVDEVRRECRAQLERAVVWGIGVRFLSARLEALTLRPEFFDVLLDLAVEFSLPIRLPDADGQATAGFPMRELAVEAGVLSPDRVLHAESYGSTADLLDAVATLDGRPLDPGVGATSGQEIVEVVFKPALDTNEFRAITGDWQARVDQFDEVSRFAAGLSELGLPLVRWAHLYEQMRA